MSQVVAVTVAVEDPECEWSSGLFSCFDDCGSCMFGWCCAPCAIASARSDFDGSNWCFNCCCANWYSCGYGFCATRNIVREGYHIEGSCIGDLCLPFWCCTGPCALCQVLRETKIRGQVQGTVTVQAANGRTITKQAKDGNNVWGSGLFSCCSDLSACCYACWCPCCATASATAKYDGSNWIFNCLCKSPCLAQSVIRTGKYDIAGSCCDDCCAPFFFGPCAISRLIREVEARGNVHQVQQPGLVEQPPMQN